MPPDHPERVADLVAQALEIEPARRSAFLAGACRDDPALRTEVESLLQFQENTPAFFDGAAYELTAESFSEMTGILKPGERLGDYRILSLIGEGGMGEVYLAQDHSLGRNVAIKLIKRSAGGTNLVRHFQREERILATLTDPYIARLYGAAATDDGAPYFVMEYVDGQPLDEYCAQRGLSVVERLNLFCKICSAVSYAHRHLVIHRDLKPANIRVTSEGEPKLLDFGIARLIDTESLEQTITLPGVMTPKYASPEQVRGENMTTASDVYSLGVVLYELLSGQSPYRTKTRNPEEISRAIREQEPERPSTAARHGPEKIRNEKSLAGDLDNIILMALRKEPERRYASVAQFSEDIRRHLDGLPVSARKDTIGYRASKFIRRHKAGVVAAALVVLMLLGGLAAISWEAHRAEQQRARAERRFNEVRRLADSLVFEIHDSVKNLQGSTPTRRLIVSRALEYLDILAQEVGDNPLLQRDLASAYEKIGDIQGNPYNANLGDTEGALASYRKAKAIREALVKTSTDTAMQMELGRSYRGLGDVLELKGDVAGTIANYRHSLDLFTELAAAHPTDPPVQAEFARACETLADGLGRTENSRQERLRWYDQALAIRQHLLEAQPSDPALRRSVGVSFLKVSSVTDSKEPTAVEDNQRAIEILEALARADPDNQRARRDVGFAYYRLGNLMIERGDFPAALVSREKALAVREQVAADDPKDTQARFDLAVGHADLAEALARTGQTDRALDEQSQALRIFQDLSVADPSNAVLRRNIGLCFEHYGDTLSGAASAVKNPVAQRKQQWTEARDWYQKGFDLFSGLRRQGGLLPEDAHLPEKLAAETERCETADRALSAGQ